VLAKLSKQAMNLDAMCSLVRTCRHQKVLAAHLHCCVDADSPAPKHCKHDLQRRANMVAHSIGGRHQQHACQLLGLIYSSCTVCECGRPTIVSTRFTRQLLRRAHVLLLPPGDLRRRLPRVDLHLVCMVSVLKCQSHRCHMDSAACMSAWQHAASTVPISHMIQACARDDGMCCRLPC